MGGAYALSPVVSLVEPPVVSPVEPPVVSPVEPPVVSPVEPPVVSPVEPSGICPLFFVVHRLASVFYLPGILAAWRDNYFFNHLFKVSNPQIDPRP
ncbi:MAG: hypothetical protein E3K36_15935 [Candidatus Brocadia sp.]|nr:hypothetical protein [Candidatus Brocadia sp.]